MRSDRLRWRRFTAGCSTVCSFMAPGSPHRAAEAIGDDPEPTPRSAREPVLEDLAVPLVAGEADDERLGAGEALLLVPLDEPLRAGPAVDADEADRRGGRLLVGAADERAADVLALVGARGDEGADVDLRLARGLHPRLGLAEHEEPDRLAVELGDPQPAPGAPGRGPLDPRRA